MAGIGLKIESNIASLREAVINLEEGLSQGLQFAAGQIEQGIRFTVFEEVVTRLSNAAGGFPAIYREHLLEFMKLFIPVEISVTGGVLVLQFNLEALGDKEALSLGYHDQALLDTNFPPFAIHPSRSQLSGGNSDVGLMEYPERTRGLDDKATRTLFWNQVIINRDVAGFAAGSTMTNLAALIEKFPIPTYEQVAARRVSIWIQNGVAPEWLLLEYGTPEGSNPVIRPVDFLGILEVTCQCYADTVIEQYVQTLIDLFNRQELGGVTSLGRPFELVPRRGGGTRPSFVKYKDILSSHEVDTSGCFGI